MEGVHLRFGPVARGGLRWSDRPQDFRTEVLGLVKAQQVKNAVIVPVGAKGGFVPSGSRAAGRDAIFEAGRQAYIAFVDRLLAVTDDIDGDGESCRRKAWCATTATTPISSSPPTRARRPSPIPPTRSR